MTLRTGTSNSAFTLIELILVLAILVMTASIVTPIMAGFFRGRAQDSEARRFLAATRFAQSRAIGEGVAMRLWVDASHGSYGVQVDPRFNDKDVKEQDFYLDKDITIGTIKAVTALSIPSATATVLHGLPCVLFQPDGTIDPASIAGVQLLEKGSRPLWVMETADNFGYEIRTEQPTLATLRH
jgi:type II secretion system protein H